MIETLHAEWTKLRTVASSGWLLLTTIVVTVGIGAIGTDVVKCPASCGIDTTKMSLTGIILGQAAVAGLAVVSGSKLLTRIKVPTLRIVTAIVLTGLAVYTLVSAL